MELKTKNVATIAPGSLEIKTYLLSPLDISCYTCNSYVAWPFFYTHGLDGRKVKESLNKVSEKYPLLCGRIKNCEDTRYAVEVDKTKTDSYGFCFTEQSSELSIAETILKHSQIVSKSADYPLYPEVPFFVDAINVAAALRGEAPLFAVKLTHFKDGCAVSFSISHLMCDGQHFAELCRDVSQVYCGQLIPDRDLDRSYFWPDQLVKYYPFLSNEIAKMPRKASGKQEKLEYLSFPEESSSLEVLYFSKKALDRMKNIGSLFLPEGSFVSTNDVLMSFWWLLQSELKAKKHPVANGTDLEIANTTVNCAVDLQKYGIDVVPQSYSGNSRIHCYFNSEGLPVEGKSIPELLSLLAARVRSTLTQLKKDSTLQAQTIMTFYHSMNSGTLPNLTDRYRGGTSNLVKTPIQEVDFGSGLPALLPLSLVFPLRGLLAMITQAPNNDGVYIAIDIHSNQEAMLMNSVVVKECAPLMKRLYHDFTVEEIDALLKKT